MTKATSKMDGLRPKINWEDPDLSSAVKMFKQQCELYFSVKDVAVEKQVDHILLFSGESGIRKFNSWRLTDAQKKDPKIVWEKFLGQVDTKENWRVARLYLQKYKQEEKETIDDYVSRLKLQALKCKFEDEDFEERVIEQIISGTRFSELQKTLLGKDKLTLEEALDLARTEEASVVHMAQLASVQTASASVSVSAMKTGKSCWFCGQFHAHRRESCPAYGDTCLQCNRRNHWKKMCPENKNKERDEKKSTYEKDKKKSYEASRKPSYKGKDGKSYKKRQNVHAMGQESEYETDSEDEVASQFKHMTLDAITMASIDKKTEIDEKRDEAYAYIEAKRDDKMIADVRVKVDTGAQGNTLPLRMFRKLYPEKIDKRGIPKPDVGKDRRTTLTAYGGRTLPHYGSVTLPCRYKDKEWEPTKFFITDVDGPAILGMPSSVKFKLVTLHCEVKMDIKTKINSVDDLRKYYPDQFDRIGEFPGAYHIVLNEEAQPVIHGPRKCSIHLRDELENELTKMEKQGVIRKVDEPTDWVSSLVMSRKSNGKLRICLDPKDLNKAIRRCHHKTPTLDEITHKFSGAQFFSKLDAKNGYWAVKLDDESSLLTTFNSPFGRYCFLRMPFGLVMSQDVFQQKMDQFLERCPGTVGIADDIVVFGRTEKEHDNNLHNLMTKAQDYGLVLNSEKCAIKTPGIEFFGMVYTKNGVNPDPKKVEDIKGLDPPRSKRELQEFLGMVTYMSPFIPDLSENTADLRALLKTDVDYMWTSLHDKAFNRVKSLICKETTLTYFDQEKETTIHVDASGRGLGAVLTQNGKPIAFASKSLTETEQRYANIERELLAVVFGCERFHTYVYGKHFTVESDHKPLEMIQHKALTAAPPRLQRMLLRLQPYDATVKYRPGREMVVPDGLSRGSSKNKDHIELDMQLNIVQITERRLNNIRQETAKDHILCELKEVIVHGWPDRVKELPNQLRPYWSFRDELAVEDGLILKGERVVIPKTIQEHLLTQLHMGHQGIEKTKLRAKDCVYWLDITKDIEQLVRSCSVCQEYQKSLPHETLKQHELPTRPWQVLGTDLFQLKGEPYLIVADYYSKFPIIRKMPQPCTSLAVVNATMEIFSEHGIPSKVISDNGGHYDSANYKDFAASWGFTHVTSSPHYPQSNGYVECSIQTVKNTLKKAQSSEYNSHMALLCLRTTPVDSIIPSPAELLYKRKIQGNIPVHIKNTVHLKDQVRTRMEERQADQKAFHDKRARDQAPLIPGQTVRVQDQKSGLWAPAKVLEKCPEPRSYVVQTPQGKSLRRNRRHLQGVPSPRRDTGPDSTSPPTRAEVPRSPVGHTTRPVTTESVAPRPAEQPRLPAPEVTRTTRSGRAVHKPKILDL